MRSYRHARARTARSISYSPDIRPGSKVIITLREQERISPESRGNGLLPASPDGKEETSSFETSNIDGANKVWGDSESTDDELRDSYFEADSYAMLQDFALCSPSQRIQLIYMFPPFSPGFQRLLDQGGYIGSRAGRAVLLWFDGPRISQEDIVEQILKDGKSEWAQEVQIEMLRGSSKRSYDDRKSEGTDETRRPKARGHSVDGLGTAVDGFEVDFQAESNQSSASSLQHELDSLLASESRRVRDRWILTFPHETDAHRFIREWSRRSMDSGRAGEPRTVHTELLW